MEQVRKEIVMVCNRIWQLGFVAANDGNISVRLEDGNFITTPTGVSKSFVTEDMLVLVDKNGKVLQAKEGYKPSSEFPMHLKCYSDRPDVNAVVHAHPPTATGFAIARIPLDKYTMPEAIINLGSVPIAKYGTPSTDEIPDAIQPFLQEHDVMLLENHGALCLGSSLINAYYKMETLELFAKSSLTARLLGGEVELSRQQIDDVLQLRAKFNIQGKHPGYKKYS